MDYLDRIQQFRDDSALQQEKQAEQILEVTLAKGIKNQVELSSREVQHALVEAVRALTVFFRQHEPSVTVKNQSQFPSSISTPDVKQVTNAVEKLTKVIGKGADFKVLEKRLSALQEAVEKLPKPPDVVTVSNQPDYTRDLQALNTSVNKLKLSPAIKVPEPRVTVNNDFAEVVAKLGELETAVTGIKFPEVKFDVTKLEKATKDVQRSISGLRFPVPNYVLPFSKDGKATQVTLNSDGTLPIGAVTISPGLAATAAYGLNDKEAGATYNYYGFERADGAWYIMRKELSTNAFRYVAGASDYSTAWTNRGSQSYALYGSTF